MFCLPANEINAPDIQVAHFEMFLSNFLNYEVYLTIIQRPKQCIIYNNVLNEMQENIYTWIKPVPRK